MARRSFSRSPHRRRGAKDLPPTRSAQAKPGPTGQISQLQQTIGNRAVGRMVQAKLNVGAPNDKYEQEADRVAEQVVSMPEQASAVSHDAAATALQRKPTMDDEKRVLQGPHELAKGPHEEEEGVVRRAPMKEEEDDKLRRQPRPEEEDEKKKLQAKADAGGLQVSHQTQSKIDNMKGGGQPLPKDTRNFFESSLGEDLSRVRVHTDTHAAEIANSINARAFTVGRDIAFNSGEYAPETNEGKRLLAHELTHVAQQNCYSLREKPILQRFGPRGFVLSKAHLLNKADMLRNVLLKELFSIFATNQKEYTTSTWPPYFFTIEWIQGEGKISLQNEITLRLSSVSEREKIANINFIDNEMHQNQFDSNRKNELRDMAGRGLPLTYEQRNKLKPEIAFRMSTAFTNFVSASIRKQNAIKAELKEKVDILTMFFDVVMVFGGPALAKGIRYLANKLPIHASNTAYRIAIAGLDENRTKNIFSAATKATKDMIRTEANSLFGETEIDKFISSLRGKFGVDAQVLRGKLDTLTDEELGVLYCAYDAEVATEDQYVAEIEKLLSMYKKYVRPISRHEKRRGETGWLGDVTVHETTYNYKIAAWIEGSSKKALALVEYSVSISGDGFFSAPQYKFLGYIPPEIKDMAINQTAQIWRYGTMIPTVHYSQVSKETILPTFGLDSKAQVPEFVMKTQVIVDK